MEKRLWILWLQGVENAPPLVQKCIARWHELHPDWDVRVLDAATLQNFVDLDAYVDLKRQAVTAASLSDIARIALLHEYGGVWADATVYCNQRLDDWLPTASSSGFFAFANDSKPKKALRSWFLAARPDHPLITQWATRVRDYWKEREKADNYFWFHNLFGELLQDNQDLQKLWNRVPRLHTTNPRAIQFDIGMYEPFDTVKDDIDWTEPMFKLTHRVDMERATPETLIAKLLGFSEHMQHPPLDTETDSPVCAPTDIAALKVSTDNRGDHVQIIAADNLLKRFGFSPKTRVDRDHEIGSMEFGAGVSMPLLINGWFKYDASQWPPNPAFQTQFLGFHMRPKRCATLLSQEALSYYRAHAPIGCRDVFTENLLRHNGVEAYTSNCLSLTFPRRLPCDTQTEVFIVSKDRVILDHMPDSLGKTTFINHYSGIDDFDINMAATQQLLETYRDRARLIVTTLLHCALPAIAMGIPVVILYPIKDAKRQQSDRERFSSLERLIRIFRFDEIGAVNWDGETIDVSAEKLAIIENFASSGARAWRAHPQPPIGPIAPASILPLRQGSK